MKLGLAVVWKGVRNGVDSGLEFSKWGMGGSYDLYHPLKIRVLKYQITSKVKGESPKQGSRGRAPNRGWRVEPLKGLL